MGKMMGNNLDIREMTLAWLPPSTITLALDDIWMNSIFYPSLADSIVGEQFGR